MPAVRRLVAVLLLALTSFTVAYSLSPLLAPQCICDHPADVPCDCPHHHAGGTMPCHRHLHARHAPAAGSIGCAVRNHCGSRPAPLLLLTQAARPMPIFGLVHTVAIEPVPTMAERARVRAIAPERRPPRATV